MPNVYLKSEIFVQDQSKLIFYSFFQFFSGRESEFRIQKRRMSNKNFAYFWFKIQKLWPSNNNNKTNEKTEKHYYYRIRAKPKPDQEKKKQK